MDRLSALFRLVELADSALPVGGFSFSSGLETAVEYGLVYNAATLEAYLDTRCRAAATQEGVAALAAYRGAQQGNLTPAIRADQLLEQRFVGEETRRMSHRMGRKLAELGCHYTPHGVWMSNWQGRIVAGEVMGHHAPTLGLLAREAELSERALFALLLYGTASQLTGAALRLMRIHHLETQRILYGWAERLEPLYEEVRPLELDQMHRFAPEAEILASLHERGEHRLFMN